MDLNELASCLQTSARASRSRWRRWSAAGRRQLSSPGNEDSEDLYQDEFDEGRREELRRSSPRSSAPRPGSTTARMGCRSRAASRFRTRAWRRCRPLSGPSKRRAPTADGDRRSGTCSTHRPCRLSSAPRRWLPRSRRAWCFAGLHLVRELESCRGGRREDASLHRAVRRLRRHLHDDAAGAVSPV